MARQQRNRKRERTWRMHLRRQSQSGQSVRDYCLEHHLHESAFYFWRRTIAERDRELTDSNAPAFVPVTLVEQPSIPSASPIDIRLAKGRRIRVRAGCDRELLAMVLAVLEKPTC